jgi:hypothetical protein
VALGSEEIDGATMGAHDFTPSASQILFLSDKLFMF